MVKVNVWDIFNKERLLKAVEEAIKEIRTNPDYYRSGHFGFEQNEYIYVLETIADSHHGIYIPKIALQYFGINPEEVEYEAMEDLWDEVENIAMVIEDELNEYLSDHLAEDVSVHFHSLESDGSYCLMLILRDSFIRFSEIVENVWDAGGEVLDENGAIIDNMYLDALEKEFPHEAIYVRRENDRLVDDDGQVYYPFVGTNCSWRSSLISWDEKDMYVLGTIEIGNRTFYIVGNNDGIRELVNELANE